MSDKATYEQLEKSLREAEACNRYLLALSPFPVTITTLEEGRFIRVNDAFYLNSGYAEQEVIGRTFSDLNIYADLSDRQRLMAQLRAQGHVQGFQTRLRGKDGTVLHVKISAQVIQSGGREHLLTIATNVESIRQTQQALAQSERRFHTILESITESYYEADLAGRLTFFNNASTKLLGYSPEEMMGMSYKAYTNPEEGQKLFDTFNAVYATGTPVKFVEYAIRRKDGTEMQVETSTSLLRDSEGRPIGFYGILRDRSEQKKAEEALRQSEESYRGILELAPDAITVGRLEDGRYLQVNDAFCRLTGYSAEEAMGRTALELNLYVNPRDREEMLADLRTHGRVEGREIQFRSKSGAILHALTSAQPIQFRGQACLMVIVTNITALTKAQKELRQSEAKYRNILEVMEEGYYEVDLAGNYIAFNESTLRFHGFSAEELMGMPFSRYLAPEKSQAVGRLFAEMSRTGIPIKILDHEIVRMDGSHLMIEMSAYPLKDASGKTIGFWGISRDRTERKKAELALQKSEERYRLLVEHANDGIYITQDGRIKFLNPKTAAMTGYAAKELVEMAFIDLVHPEDRAPIFELQQCKLESEHIPGVFSFRMVNKCQEMIWVELSTIGISWEGRPAALNFLRDVTLQKKMEAQLLQARKMEAVGTLAGGIAHDFNNLLMGIQGNASLAQTEIGAEHPVHGKLKSIEAYVKAGANLTKQLLGAAKGGKYEVQPSDLNQLVSTSADLFGRTKREITIYKKFEENLCPVEVDRGQIAQVLLNLFVNAWQAMPSGGELYLETANVQLDDFYVQPYGVPSGKYAKLSVTDTGHGIDPQDQKRIFDPFFTTKGLGGGSGLGLASAYGIITNHGGIISVYSEKGSGATFNIYLPASERKVIEFNELKATIVTGKETVLFVDDEEGIVEIGRLILEKLGYTVIEAHGGSEAIAIFRAQKEKIDIVILDMIMPGMSGGETFGELKEIDPHVKVLLSSGYSINGQAQSIMDLGCDGFIQKPFNMQDLSIKVRKVLDGRD